MIMAWSVDRLGRSLQDLVAFVSEIHALKIDLYLHQQGLDTTTPAGKAVFQIMGVFAEFERAIRNGSAPALRGSRLRVRRWGGPGSRLAWKPRSAPLYRRATWASAR
jgi:DNA invertase Pin-like site-specific DNA recombinase